MLSIFKYICLFNGKKMPQVVSVKKAKSGGSKEPCG